MKLKLSLDVIYEVSPEVIKELAIEFGSRDDVLKGFTVVWSKI